MAPKGRPRNSALNSKVSTLSMGQRTKRAPVAQNRSSTQTGRNSLRFRESERILSIPGSVSFANTVSVPCNPGIATSFPWLAGHAALFENYKVHKMIYRYKNLKGTSSAGNILFSFDYDTLDNAPATAVAATQSTVYVDGAPWTLFQLRVPPDGRKLFTRGGSVSGADLKTYDMGSLHISTEGCADTSTHGYLEVDYDIEFFNKQNVSTTPANSTGGAFYQLTSNQNVGADEIVAYDTEDINQIGIVNTAGSFRVPAGTYAVDIYFAHITGVLASVKLRVDTVSQGAISNTVVPVNPTNAPTTCSYLLVLAAASNIDMYIDWTSGADVVLADYNRIRFLKL